MKSTLTIQPKYVLPEFETYFEKLEREQLALAEMLGQQDGRTNKPTSQRHYVVQVSSSFKAIIQKAIDYNYTLFKPISTIAITREIRNAAIENLCLLDKEKNAKEKKLLHLKHEQSDLKITTSSISSKLKIIIPAMFGLSEGVLLYSILQNASFPGVVKFFLSIVIAMASAFGLNLGAHHICRAEGKRRKQKRFVVVITLAFVVAAGLGIWRANISGTSANINSQIDVANYSAQPTNFSALPFILLSFISFLVALAFELKHWLSDEQKARQKTYEKILAESKKIELEKNAIQEEIKTTKANISATSGDVLRQQEYAFANERRLISLAQQLQNRYEAANMEHRPDNSCPAFFGEPITADFTLYFDNLFTNLKQKR